MSFIDIFQVRYLPFGDKENMFSRINDQAFQSILSITIYPLIKVPYSMCARFPEIIHI